MITGNGTPLFDLALWAVGERGSVALRVLGVLATGESGSRSVACALRGLWRSSSVEILNSVTECREIVAVNRGCVAGKATSAAESLAGRLGGLREGIFGRAGGGRLGGAGFARVFGKVPRAHGIGAIGARTAAGGVAAVEGEAVHE